MPSAVSGHPLHTRSLTILVTLGEDGRWRVRGDVIDLRKRGFVPMSQDVQPAGIIHQMSLSLVVDPERRRIDSLEADQPHVAVEASERTGGECCRDPVPRLQQMVGETLDAGFPKRLAACFGGPLGCSHLLTLFQLIGSGLPRAFELEAGLGRGRQPDERIFWRSVFVDGIEESDGAIGLSLQLADLHSTPMVDVRSPLDRLSQHDEVRVGARFRLPGFGLEDLRASTRSRRRANLEDAPWDDRSADLQSLAEGPILPGLARRIFRLPVATPADAVLRDALLQLAPGAIQVLAAITDRWAISADARASGGPPVAAIGGNADSCYMWRSGGALIRMRQDLADRAE